MRGAAAIKVYAKIAGGSAPKGDRVYRVEGARLIMKGEAYEYDQVIENASNAHFYDAAIRNGVVAGALEGSNCCVIFYGRSGAGKSSTLLGSSRDGRGVFQHSISQICAATPVRAIRLSVLEIYNEAVYDLVPPQPRQIVLGKSAQVAAACEREAAEVVERAVKKRRVASTPSNRSSSRSHLVITVHIAGEAPPARSKLSFIDLAGFEKYSGSESISINRSLLSLNNVIIELSKNSKYVSYRNSRLTQLIRSELEGRVAFVVCLRGELDEAGVLGYASKARGACALPSTARACAAQDPLVAEVERLRRENEALKRENAELRGAVERHGAGGAGTRSTANASMYKNTISSINECINRHRDRVKREAAHKSGKKVKFASPVASAWQGGERT